MDLSGIDLMRMRQLLHNLFTNPQTGVETHVETHVLRAFRKYVPLPILFLGIWGNLLTIILLQRRTLRRLPSRILLTAYSSVNLTQAFIQCVLQVGYIWGKEYALIDQAAEMCDMVRYVSLVIDLLSPWILILSSIQRMVFIFNPIKSLESGGKRYYIAFVVILIVVIGGNIPLITGQYETPPAPLFLVLYSLDLTSKCTNGLGDSKGYAVYIFLFLKAGVPLLALVVVNTAIIVKLRLHNRSSMLMKVNDAAMRQRVSTERSVSVVACGVTLTHLLLNTPPSAYLVHVLVMASRGPIALSPVELEQAVPSQMRALMYHTITDLFVIASSNLSCYLYFLSPIIRLELRKMLDK